MPPVVTLTSLITPTNSPHLISLSLYISSKLRTPYLSLLSSQLSSLFPILLFPSLPSSSLPISNTSLMFHTCFFVVTPFFPFLLLPYHVTRAQLTHPHHPSYKCLLHSLYRLTNVRFLPHIPSLITPIYQKPKSSPNTSKPSRSYPPHFSHHPACSLNSFIYI